MYRNPRRTPEPETGTNRLHSPSSRGHLIRREKRRGSRMACPSTSPTTVGLIVSADLDVSGKSGQNPRTNRRRMIFHLRPRLRFAEAITP